MNASYVSENISKDGLDSNFYFLLLNIFLRKTEQDYFMSRIRGKSFLKHNKVIRLFPLRALNDMAQSFPVSLGQP